MISGISTQLGSYYSNNYVKNTYNPFKAKAPDMNAIVERYSDLQKNRSSWMKQFRELSEQKDFSIKDWTDSLTNGTEVKSSADSLEKAAQALNDKSLFTPDENGDYDREAISKAVQDFVKSYNDTKGAVENSSNNTVLQNGVLMVGTTSAYSGLLNRAGITVNSDNTLSVNTDALEKADINTLKTLFNGETSYISRISRKAEQFGKVNPYANSYASYGNKGFADYFANYQTGTLMDMFA